MSDLKLLIVPFTTPRDKAATRQEQALSRAVSITCALYALTDKHKLPRCMIGINFFTNLVRINHTSKPGSYS